MTDPYWPFPTLQYPLTPPIAPKYSDYALKVKTEIKVGLTNHRYLTEVVLEDALL